MTATFFERPILNSPYEYPQRHWELDETGQPTQHIIEARRAAKYLTPIPRPKKQKRGQKEIVFKDEKGISTEDQQYDPTPIINAVLRRFISEVFEDDEKVALAGVLEVLGHVQVGVHARLEHRDLAELRELGGCEPRS